MPPILVIEDDRDSREALCHLLRAQGFPIVEAANGLEGLKRLDDLPSVALILLDLMMPVMSGWDFRRLQLAHPVHHDVPVMVLTADARASGRMSELRPQALLTKPLDFTQVLSRIHRLFQVSGRH